MKRTFLSFAAAVLALGLFAAPAAAQEGIEIRDIDQDQFPRVTLTVSVEGAIDETLLNITENGKAVADSEIKSVKGVEGAVDVVLAIDVSASMEGDSMAAALEAARQFIEQLPPEIEVGVVAFGDEAQVLSAMTPDHQAAFDSMASLQPFGDTALYDGISEAIDLFPSQGQHNIVLLSDGADNPPPFGFDNVSIASLDEVVEKAGDSQVKIFAIGLQTGDFKAGALRALSNQSGGNYFAVEAVDLDNLYSNIATEIAEQYLVSWKSTTTSGDPMSIKIAAGAESDNIVVFAPRSRVEDPIPPTAPGGVNVPPLLTGALGLVIVCALTFGGVFLLLSTSFGERSRRIREKTLKRRLGGTAGIAVAEKEGSTSWIPEPLIEVAEKFASTERRSRIDEKLERAGWALKSTEYVGACILGALVGAVVGLLLARTPLMMIAMALLGSRVPGIVVSISQSRRLEKIQTQLPDVLMVLASSLRAGYSFLQALDSVAKEVGGPAGLEFSRVVAEIRLGRPIEVAMTEAAERIGSPDFKWAVLAVNIQRDVGGNLAELLDTVATTMREREQLRRQVKVLSAEGRLSMWILVALPFVTGAWIAIVNPDYFSLLFETQIGVVMLVVAACMLVLGMTWMKKVVKIDV